jgi:superoxide dismutase, Fe-Mn family
MKNFFFKATCFAFLLVLFSCHEKKLIEVVEVPLPSVEEKITIGIPDDVKANEGPFQLEKLAYHYDAFLPKLSAVTLENHYAKQYLNYTNKLNESVKGTDLETLSIEEVLTRLDPNNEEQKNNAGGYYNHSLYFKCIAPKVGRLPKDSLAAAIDADFESFDNFTTQFKAEANKLVGSGWVWLLVNRSGKLQITTTANQDNPLMRNAKVAGKPILAMDVWEHAYYLDYQNKRKNYIDAFFTLINWAKVEENYEQAFAQ